MTTGAKLLKFRCTGCGNCCKDPLLPLTAEDVVRLSAGTGIRPRDFVQWVNRDAIDMDDGRWFVLIRPGLRVMVLKHRAGKCVFLGDDDLCTTYASRPLGCRIFPFDPTFSARGNLRRLTLIDATTCHYELDGKNDVADLRELHVAYESDNEQYLEQVHEWNRTQRRRKRAGKQVQTGSDFLRYLGLSP